MAYNYERDETVFGNWLKRVVCDALREGSVNLYDIKDLYDDVSKISYDNGYKHGKNDGYLEAVKDVEQPAGYDLSEHKE
jgi:hypothetical protein